MGKITNHNLIGLIRSLVMKFRNSFFSFLKLTEQNGAWQRRKPGIKLEYST